jgi:hypothetical protein
MSSPRRVQVPLLEPVKDGVAPIAYVILLDGVPRLTLTTAEAALLVLGAKDENAQNVIRRLIDAGQIPALSTGKGGRWLIPAQGLAEWARRAQCKPDDTRAALVPDRG